MSLDVLPLALSDLKIGSNEGSELVFSFSGFYLQFTEFCQCLWEFDSWLDWSFCVSLAVHTCRPCLIVSRSFRPCDNL